MLKHSLLQKNTVILTHVILLIVYFEFFYICMVFITGHNPGAGLLLGVLESLAAIDSYRKLIIYKVYIE